MKKFTKRQFLRANCAGLALLGTCALIGPGLAQNQEPGSRQIFDEEFTQARPTKPPTSATPPPATVPRNSGSAAVVRKPRRYRRKRVTASASLTIAPPAIPANWSDIAVSAEKVGVTIWRLRRPQSGDQGARLMVQQVEMVPVRVDSDTVMNAGDQVFLSVESPRAGYLYIIDREIRADGSLGDPYLIFPTMTTRRGDNRVLAGKLINIPDGNDEPNNFTLMPQPPRNDQVGELLSVIITAEPLENFTTPNSYLALTPAQINRWENPWGGRSEQFDLEDGAGQTMTVAELNAATMGVGARLLIQAEPPPQTFYLVEARNRKGMMVNVQLRYHPRP